MYSDSAVKENMFPATSLSSFGLSLESNRRSSEEALKTSGPGSMITHLSQSGRKGTQSSNLEKE
jgi:hypothetical protein